MKEPLPATFGASWAAASALCLWFLFVHAPAVLAPRDSIHPLLWLHLVGAYSVYLACVHNTLLTPSSLGGSARPFHVWIGRVGLALGIAGFFSGFVLVWFNSFLFNYDYKGQLGFAVGITFGGFAQMYLEVKGFLAIKRYQKIKAQIEAGDYEGERELSALRDERDEKLTLHIRSMVPLFVLACGVPALMRVCADSTGYAYLPFIIVPFYGLKFLMIRPFVKRVERARFAEEGVDESTLIITPMWDPFG